MSLVDAVATGTTLSVELRDRLLEMPTCRRGSQRDHSNFYIMQIAKACNLSFVYHQWVNVAVLQLTEFASVQRSEPESSRGARRSKVRRCMRACTKPTKRVAALECGSSAHGRNKER